eukprot:643252-Rhodomonas_salina.1
MSGADIHYGATKCPYYDMSVTDLRYGATSSTPAVGRLDAVPQQAVHGWLCRWPRPLPHSAGSLAPQAPAPPPP